MSDSNPQTLAELRSSGHRTRTVKEEIRGLPVRIPLDLVLVFSANPEDDTLRGRFRHLERILRELISTRYERDTLDLAACRSIGRGRAYFTGTERLGRTLFVERDRGPQDGPRDGGGADRPGHVRAATEFARAAKIFKVRGTGRARHPEALCSSP